MPVKRPKVLGTGFVALDLVVSPRPDARIQAWAGGTCGNVLSILAWHGWDAYPIARMNGDSASVRVKADLQRWGVRLDLAACEPTTNTPIVIQEIRHAAGGASSHKFSWTCLRCGGWLPSFKPVTRAIVEQTMPYLPDTSVFFFDRVSRGTLEVAAHAAKAGAVVMFEPSGRGDQKLFKEALELAHILKYADQRIGDLADIAPGTNLILEIQTLGADGLRFRLPHNKRGSSWRPLAAAQIDMTVDACGSGDWCTAGILARLAADGLSGLRAATVGGIQEALQYGQELAAWNCRFEGARGGMYEARATLPEPMAPVRSVLRTPATFSQDAMTALIGCPKCDAA